MYTISAVDLDLGEGGQVNYVIAARDNEGIFSVRKTMEVSHFLHSYLDYETKSFYSIAFQTYDT